MFSRVKMFLQGGSERSEDEPRGSAAARRAAAALLVEAARLDGHFDAAERKHIARILESRFAISPADVALLIEAGESESEDAVELYGVTREIRDHFDHDERVRMVEMMWEIVYADGAVHAFEANLLRRVAGLLYVTDQESGAARKRALKRVGMTGETGRSAIAQGGDSVGAAGCKGKE
jgi:uncharacterized tellurite resistance protein B-like protein